MRDGDGCLPQGWARTRLGEVILQVIGGGTPSKNIPQFYLGTIPWFSVKDMRTRRPTDSMEHISEAAIHASATNLIPPDTVIIATRIGLGKVIRVPYAATINQDLKALITPPEVEKGFLEYWILRSARLLESLGSGTTVKGIRLETLGQLEFTLPPLSEQRRIVEAIEQQFTRLDAGVAALKRAQAALKRYRAAVLKAAVEGKLTAVWRAEHPNVEPASDLLVRILAERRAKWEADVRAKGKDPANIRYDAPESPDTANLPELPDGWCWASLAALTSRIGDVDHKMPQAADSGIPYISTKDFIGDSHIDFAGAKCISKQDFDMLARKIRPQEGDILVSRYGTVGEVRRVSTSIDFQASYSIAIIKVLPTLQSGEYLAWALRSDLVQLQMRRDIRASAQPDLGLEYIRQFAIPLPPLAEQEEIVAEVEQRVSIVSELEATVEANLKRADRLRQSILERAFAGKLVPQDSEDEPASVLLERIREQRERFSSNGRSSHREAAITAQATLWGKE